MLFSKPLAAAESLSIGDSGAQVEAKGNVEIRRGDTLLKAEEVRVNRTTQDVEAECDTDYDADNDSDVDHRSTSPAPRS